jgi:hypothetical protein
MNIGKCPPVTYARAKGGEVSCSGQTMVSATARSLTSIIERILSVEVTVWPPACAARAGLSRAPGAGSAGSWWRSSF